MGAYKIFLEWSAYRSGMCIEIPWMLKAELPSDLEQTMNGKIVWRAEFVRRGEEAVANSWFLCKQNAISNKILLKIKMDRLKFELEIVEALSASPPTNKSILTDDEDNSVVVRLAKRSKHYSPHAVHVMAFILAIP
ncbi:uncharacterized protein TNCV_1041141 [Trichonephila clavipes]|nr:uncharacterized protein TNCV_1041141 [Trichonephila clavipes]